ncbi:MAG TPA: hypothetical protein VG847_05240 [Chitinophagaceae bacterium]|nr:hypothetical protein [Chitinophagaceae bacterium]
MSVEVFGITNGFSLFLTSVLFAALFKAFLNSFLCSFICTTGAFGPFSFLRVDFTLGFFTTGKDLCEVAFLATTFFAAGLDAFFTGLAAFLATIIFLDEDFLSLVFLGAAFFAATFLTVAFFFGVAIITVLFIYRYD